MIQCSRKKISPWKVKITCKSHIKPYFRVVDLFWAVSEQVTKYSHQKGFHVKLFITPTLAYYVIFFTFFYFIPQGQSIIPMLTGEVIPVMELLSSMKSHSVPEEIDVSS